MPPTTPAPKPSTLRTRRWRERQKGGLKSVPDTKIVAFPSNHRGADSPGAHLATWGPNHDILPLRAGNIVLVEKGRLIATFSLRIVMQGVGLYLYGCKFVQWGQGQRVLLSEREVRIAGGRSYYHTLLLFDSNTAARAFEEAALSAIRFALGEFRRRHSEAAGPEPEPPIDDGVAAADHAEEDIPF